MHDFKKKLNSLGPGLLFAGAAVGVSHLVQSTRAGADFGLGLLWAPILICIIKYPFFQFGPRYASATGESLLDGYKKLGKGALITSYVMTFVNMFTFQAGVTIVTASLAVNLFGVTDNLVLWSYVLMIVCVALLGLGRYRLLDSTMRYIVIALSLSTVIAMGIAFSGAEQSLSLEQVLPSTPAQVIFLIAFLGWMPAPLDASMWHSLWSVEKDKNTAEKITPKESLFDFNVGYVSTLFLGFCFLMLGALVMYQVNDSFSPKGAVFASQLIKLYTENLGDFSYIFIATAAFTTMFSTTLTTLDASSRVMTRATKLLFNDVKKLGSYVFWLLVITAGTFIILNYFLGNMILLVKIGTVLSFLIGPVYAILNYLLITGKHTPEEHRPGLGLRIFSIMGIVFLIGFDIWFLLNL